LSFYGKSRFYSLAAILVIPAGLTVIGVRESSGSNEHYFGLLTGIMLIFYALGEEYGWRGYLQQALFPIKEAYRILLIAVLWYIWHLNFLIPGITVKSHIIHFLSLLLGSWGLMKISESSYSILFVAAVHLSFNVISDVDSDFTKKMILISVSVVIWTILLISLNKNNKIEKMSIQQ
jgi:membrane protease YdiL (CAAX protease family)